MKLFLQPNDTFFFRDGKPFTKGEQSEGHSIFPPLPSTALGALRSAYIAAFGDLSIFYSGGMQHIVGTPKSLCNAIRLRGIFPSNSRDNQLDIFFPVPLDLIYRKDDEGSRHIPLHLLTPAPHNFKSNGSMNTILRWADAESIDSNADGLLDLVGIEQYLVADDTALLLVNRNTLIERESKIGIARSRDTLSSEDHMLYRIDMHRFRNRDGIYGFIVDYECHKPLPTEGGLLKLGGEGKSFAYRDIDLRIDCLSNSLESNSLWPNFLKPVDNLSTDSQGNHLETIKASIQSTGKFKLYFATPTIFKNGWLPSWLDSDTFSGEYPAGQTSPICLKLVTAAVGKPIVVGGWNMARNGAKRSFRAVPAGSVYYFELIDKSRTDDLITAFHYQNISDKRSKEGFGLAFIAVAEGGNS